MVVDWNKDWKTSEQLKEAVADHVSKEFPPTYITDGNAYSFQEQGQALENRLTELKVPVQSLFIQIQKRLPMNTNLITR